MTQIVSMLHIAYWECRDCGKRFSELCGFGCEYPQLWRRTHCPVCDGENVEPLTLALARKMMKKILHK